MTNNYLVAVLPNQQQAEQAYKALSHEDVPMQQVSILGAGYQSANDFGLVHPDAEADKQSQSLSFWVIPFGFIAGFTFSLATGLDTFAWADEWGNHIVGGLLGAASGALGSYVVGRITGWTLGSGDAIAYRNRLNAGRYLIIAQGNEQLVRHATRILRQFDLEAIQGYVEPTRA